MSIIQHPTEAGTTDRWVLDVLCWMLDVLSVLLQKSPRGATCPLPVSLAKPAPSTIS
jgi:hypothetical protein